MESILWKESKNDYLHILTATKEYPAIAFCLKGGIDDKLYYFCIFEIPTKDGCMNYCLITDASELSNDNHGAGLAHYRKYCLNIQNIATDSAFDGMPPSVANNIKTKYTNAGNLVFAIAKDDGIIWPLSIQINQRYLGKKLVHHVFNFLYDPFQRAVRTNNVLITTTDIAMVNEPSESVSVK